VLEFHFNSNEVNGVDIGAKMVKKGQTEANLGTNLILHPKVDVLVTLETMFKEVKENLANGQNIYIRGFGSFITKKRAAKIGRNIKKNIAVEIPEHFIPAFKPAKEFVNEVKSKRK